MKEYFCDKLDGKTYEKHPDCVCICHEKDYSDKGKRCNLCGHDPDL